MHSSRSESNWVRLFVISLFLLPARHAGAHWCGSATPQPPNPPQPPSCNSSPKPCDCDRSPCSVSHFDYHFGLTDLSLTAPALPVAFGRSYNSSRQLDGVLGVGWASSLSASAYSSAVIVDPPFYSHRDVVIRWSDTRYSTFRVNYQDVYGNIPSFYKYDSSAGVPASLKRDSISGTWVARQNLNPSIARLDNVFKLLSMETSEGSAQKLNLHVRHQRTPDGNCKRTLSGTNLDDKLWSRRPNRVDR